MLRIKNLKDNTFVQYAGKVAEFEHKGQAVDFLKENHTGQWEGNFLIVPAEV